MTPRARKTPGILAATVALAVLSACSNVGPQDYLNPEGPVAKQQHNLFLPVFIIAGVIGAIVMALILIAIIRFRESKNTAEPVQVHGNTRLELGWTLAPAILLAAISVPTVATIFSLAEEPKGPDVVRVKVIGHQWWWEYQYDTKPQIKTATELVIPTGKKVFLTVTSVDVIHSFWVPKLGGKQDAVPNRDNFMTIEATKPGTYHGQCAEFCALSHANMRLRVVAKTPADYAAWVKAQQAPAVVPTEGLAAAGADAFRGFNGGTCIACHTVRGVEGAGGQIGPDLTHFASREEFAGAILKMNEQDLTAWLRNPPGLKPGSKMRNYQIPEDTIRALVAFLLSLK